MDASFSLGCSVVFTDEHGKQCVGTVVSIDVYDMEGMLGIDWVYGIYVRHSDDVRIATPDEVNRWHTNGSL